MYPLLIQGLFSNTNGTNDTVKPGALTVPRAWTNSIQLGRGNVIAVDPVITNSDATPIIQSGSFNYTVGSVQVISNGQNNMYVPTARPGAYKILPLKISGGQTVTCSFINNATAQYGIVMHHYFENAFARPSVFAAINDSSTKQRIQDFNVKFNGSLKFSPSPTFVLPTGLGNVVGVEYMINAEIGGGLTYADLQNVLFTVNVGGTNIMENASTAIFLPTSGRPDLIFPIVIRPGQSFNINADTSNLPVASQIIITMRVYFDNDQTGTKTYK